MNSEESVVPAKVLYHKSGHDTRNFKSAKQRCDDYVGNMIVQEKICDGNLPEVYTENMWGEECNWNELYSSFLTTTIFA